MNASNAAAQHTSPVSHSDLGAIGFHLRRMQHVAGGGGVKKGSDCQTSAIRAMQTTNYPGLHWNYEADGAEVVAYLESLGYNVMPTPSMLKNDNESLALRIKETYSSLHAQIDGLERRFNDKILERARTTGDVRQELTELASRCAADYERTTDRLDNLEDDLKSDLATLAEQIGFEFGTPEPDPTPAFPRTMSSFTFRPKRGQTFTVDTATVALDPATHKGMYDKEGFSWRVFELHGHTIAHLGFNEFVYLQPGGYELAVTVPEGTPVAFLTDPLKS